MNFRKDINGLRAVAVLGVLFFHFFPEVIPGGFTGVDVFFVISGFFMTAIIFGKIDKNKFSLKSFYVARANRILPELIVLCAVVLFFGFFFVTPLAYKSLAKHALSSLTFLSNFVYTFESGYFDVASHDKWFLHTWSLSVEWQFYLIYPLVITLLAMKGISIKKIALGVLIVTALSFLLSCSTSTIWPNAAYFCLPTRLWELTLGAVTYLYPLSLSKRTGVLFEALGFVLIICSYFCISEKNTFPGYLALFPTLGAFLIIQAHREHSLITNNRVFQKIGEWSYSIYLWHYPLTVIIFSFALPNVWKIPFLLMAILLGFLSNKYIATRKHRGVAIHYYKRMIGLVFSSVFIFSCIIFGSNIFAKMKLKDDSSFVLYQDLIKTKKETLAHYNLNYTDYKKQYTEGSTCSFDKEMPTQYAFQCVNHIIKNDGWLVIGDSHGRDFYHSLQFAYPQQNIAMLQQSSCAPAKAIKQNSKIVCFREMEKIIDFINSNKNIKKVIFAARYTNESSTPFFIKQLKSGVYKRDLIVVNSGVHFDRDISNYLYKYGAREYYPIEQKFIHPKHKINDKLSSIHQNNIKIFDKYHVFCNGEDSCKLIDHSNVLFIDNQHLSEKGMIYLAKRINQSKIME